MTVNIGVQQNSLSDKRRYLYSKTPINKTKRAHELGQVRYVPKKLRQAILVRDNFICQICGNLADQIDHIVPWRISHDNNPSNLRAICQKCNMGRRLPRRDKRLPLPEYWEAIEKELSQSTK